MGYVDVAVHGSQLGIGRHIDIYADTRRVIVGYRHFRIGAVLEYRVEAEIYPLHRCAAGYLHRTRRIGKAGLARSYLVGGVIETLYVVVARCVGRIGKPHRAGVHNDTFVAGLPGEGHLTAYRPLREGFLRQEVCDGILQQILPSLGVRDIGVVEAIVDDLCRCRVRGIIIDQEASLAGIGAPVEDYVGLGIGHDGVLIAVARVGHRNGCRKRIGSGRDGMCGHFHSKIAGGVMLPAHHMECGIREVGIPGRTRSVIADLPTLDEQLAPGRHIGIEIRSVGRDSYG